MNLMTNMFKNTLNYYEFEHSELALCFITINRMFFFQIVFMTLNNELLITLPE